MADDGAKTAYGQARQDASGARGRNISGNDNGARRRHRRCSISDGFCDTSATRRGIIDMVCLSTLPLAVMYKLLPAAV
jgi:hypothetical protein